MFQLVLGKTNIEFSVPKTKGIIQTFIRDRCKSKHLSCYWGPGISTNSTGDLHLCEGTTDMEADINLCMTHHEKAMMTTHC